MKRGCLNMKNKKTMWYFIACIAIVAIVLVGFFFFSPNETSKNSRVANLKEVSIGDVPKFSIVVTGAYTGVFVEKDISNIKTYEFDGTLDNGWTVEKNHYVGVRVKDAFDLLSIKDYKNITFKSVGGVSVEYKSSDITDDTFFIIKKDGEIVSEEVLNVVSFDKDYNYTVEDLSSIDVVKEG